MVLHMGLSKHCSHRWTQWLKYKFGAQELFKKLGSYCKLKGPLSTCSYH